MIAPDQLRIGQRVLINKPDDLIDGYEGTIQVIDGRRKPWWVYVAVDAQQGNRQFTVAEVEVRHIQPVTRPLSSLSDAECAEVYRLAFGRDNDRAIRTDRGHPTIVDITGYSYMLSVHQDGRMIAMSELSGEGTEFNAVAVVRYLDSLGIALGAE